METRAQRRNTEIQTRLIPHLFPSFTWPLSPPPLSFLLVMQKRADLQTARNSSHSLPLDSNPLFFHQKSPPSQFRRSWDFWACGVWCDPHELMGLISLKRLQIWRYYSLPHTLLSRQVGRNQDSLERSTWCGGGHLNLQLPWEAPVSGIMSDVKEHPIYT